jgi:hypothetical protein
VVTLVSLRLNTGLGDQATQLGGLARRPMTTPLALHAVGFMARLPAGLK